MPAVVVAVTVVVTRNFLLYNEYKRYSRSFLLTAACRTSRWCHLIYLKTEIAKTVYIIIL